MANYTLTGSSNGTEYYEGSGTFDGDSNGKDYITGSDGVDVINAGNGEDTLEGLGGNDILVGGNGDDKLIGGAGDDLLTGGNGADAFGYAFTLTAASSSGPQSYAAYLQEAVGKTHDEGTLTQSEFSTTYSAWLNYLVFGDGQDWQGLVDHFGWEGEVKIGLNQNGAGDSQPHISLDGVAMDLDDLFGDAESFSWTKGKATQTRTFWDIDEDYNWGGETAVTSNDGKDTIVDFKSDSDPTKSDKLFFTIDIDGDPAALSTVQRTDLADTFKAKFEIETAFLDAGTTTDTRMTLDDGMSITLLGYDGGNDIWNHVEFSFV